MADVVHKIKNNLGGIGGFASLLERDLDEDDPRMRLVTRIQESVERLNNFVVDLMFLVRDVQPECEHIRLLPLLKEILQNEEKESARGKVMIQGDENVDLPALAIFADPHLIREMMLQLVIFIRSSGGKVERVFVAGISDDVLKMQFIIQGGDMAISLPADFSTLIKRFDRVETRLSLSIVLKMAQCFDARVSYAKTGQATSVISVQMMKDK